MNKKNTSILVLAIIVLIGSISFVIWRTEQKKSTAIKTTQEKNNTDNNTPENNVPKDNVAIDQMTKEQADFANKFKQDMEQKKAEKEISGTVESIGIGGKGITLKNDSDGKMISFQLDANTKIVQMTTDEKNNQLQTGINLSDIKSGDRLDVNFMPMINLAVLLIRHK